MDEFKKGCNRKHLTYTLLKQTDFPIKRIRSFHVLLNKERTNVFSVLLLILKLFFFHVE